jgi:peptidoglycan/xylan/chitin deacetylase (PgdA/CDA1 family)
MLLIACLLLSDASARPADTRETAEKALAYAEEAVTQMAEGQYRGAAEPAQDALRLAPDDSLLLTLAGTVLLNTGEYRDALATFTQATARAPQDGLARYGLGMAQLATGERRAALSSFQRAEHDDGEPATLLIAQQYARWLGDETLASDKSPMPESLTASQHALEGMRAARHNDLHSLASHLEAAWNALPGEAFAQPNGPLMTFRAEQPVTIADAQKSRYVRLDTKVPKGGVIAGNLTLSAEKYAPETAFVSYEMDGQTLSLVNVAPFEYTWDSRSVANGWHALVIVFYDRSGQEINRAERRVHIMNRGVETVALDTSNRIARLRNALWEHLALRPDRCACAYALGTTYRTLGNAEQARIWFARTLAVSPSYRDARPQWLALGGMRDASGSALWRGPANEKIIALTFDDGPKPGVTEPLLDALIQEHVPATFFLVGRQVTLHPALARKIAAAGMEIAKHSYTHPNLTTLTAEGVAREVMQAQAALEAATGEKPRFLRPPGGAWSNEVAQAVRHWGLTPCFWTVDVYGAEIVGAQQVIQSALAKAHPGYILLLHNGTMTTVQALPTILHTLRARGYSFVTISELARRVAAAKDTTPWNAAPHERQRE